MSRLLAIPLSLALLLAVLLAERSAWAEIAIFQEQSLGRFDANGNALTKRPLTSKPEGISRRDCEDDQRIQFPLALSGFEANGSLQVWASLGGTDCGSPASRSGTTAVCWSLVPDVPLVSSSNVSIPVRTIMAGAPPSSPARPSNSVETCGMVDLTSIAVHFLYFAPGQRATPAETKTITIEVDTVAPRALSGVSVAGDGTVRWEAHVGAGSQAGISVYCAPIEAAATCAFAPFVPPAPHPSRDLAASYACGSLGGSTETAFRVQGTPDGPFNAGRRYAFALSAFDAFENPSPLSATTCAVIDQPASPPANDSGCAANGRSPHGSTGFAALIALALLLRARRRAHERARRASSSRVALRGSRGRRADALPPRD